MENLINKLPDILKNAGSLFGVCALVAIVIGIIAFLFFGKAEPKQKERIFLYTMLFFLAFTFFTITAGVLTGYKNGGDNKVNEIATDPSKVNASLVSLQPNTIERLENYLKSKGESVSQDSKAKVLEAAIKDYTSPKKQPEDSGSGVTPSYTPTPTPTPTNPIQVNQTTRDLNVVTWELQSCVKAEKNVVRCILSLSTSQDGTYDIILKEGEPTGGAKLVDSSGNEYRANRIQMGDKFAGGNDELKFDMVIGSTYKITIDFANVPASISQATLLKVGTYGFTGWGGVKFRNVPIN